jgi:hypothetical protein
MVVRIELFIDARAPHSEVGAQINYLTTQLQQGHGELRRDAMRQGQEHDLRLLAQQLRLGLAETQLLRPRMMRELREHLRQRLPGVLAGRNGAQLRVRMRQEQAHQFLA